jgi:predicted transcriptional regulator
VIRSVCEGYGMTIRHALKQGFDAKGLTYKQFGEMAGISLSSAHKKLTGAQVMTVSEAEVYANLLGVKISATFKKGR